MATNYHNRSLDWLKQRRASVERVINRRTDGSRFYLGSRMFKNDMARLKLIDVAIREREAQLPMEGL